MKKLFVTISLALISLGAFAQKGERALKKAGINCHMQRTPKALSARGCGYCLKVRGAEAMAAVMVLGENQIVYEKTYILTGQGKPEEREL